MKLLSIILFLLFSILTSYGQENHSHGFDIKNLKKDTSIFKDYLGVPYKLVSTDTNGFKTAFIYKDSVNLYKVDSSTTTENYNFTKTTDDKIDAFLHNYIRPTQHEKEALIHISMLFNKKGELVKLHILDSVDYGCFKKGYYETPSVSNLNIPTNELPNNINYFELKITWIEICYCTCLINK